MPNNKIVDREALKATRQAFQNALENGQIVPSKAISTKQIEAISSDSGTIQEAPFISQATGTANGTVVVDTSPVGKHLEKQGNAIVYNQLVNSGTTEVATISGHKYLTIFSGVYSIISSAGQDITINDDTTDKVINLTKWFNGDIPQDILDTPAHFSRYYNGDLTYNLGEVRFGAGRYLECGQSRNVWDEEASFSSNTLSSANYIEVLPDTIYHFYAIKDSTINYYDLNQSLISTESVTADTNFTTPSNCKFIKFEIANYGTAYNNDITISLYYSTGDSYDKYFPYVAPKIYDTGPEVLRKVGTAKDIKYPNGTIIRNIVSVDLGSFDYNPVSSGNIRTNSRTQLSDAKGGVNAGLCGSYFYDFQGAVGDPPIDKCIYIHPTNKYIYITNSAFEGKTGEEIKTLLSGVILYYELTTPITEQGTPFSENIEINDYSYMSWLDTNNLLVDVPQGCKIFYPADYVLFTDSLGQKFEWDVNNIASKDDIPKINYTKIIDYTLEEAMSSNYLPIDLEGNYKRLLIEVIAVAGQQNNCNLNVWSTLSDGNPHNSKYMLRIGSPNNNYAAVKLDIVDRFLYTLSKSGTYRLHTASDTWFSLVDVGTDLTITSITIASELEEWRLVAGTQIIIYGSEE